MSLKCHECASPVLYLLSEINSILNLGVIILLLFIGLPPIFMFCVFCLNLCAFEFHKNGIILPAFIYKLFSTQYSYHEIHSGGRRHLSITDSSSLHPTAYPNVHSNETCTCLFQYWLTFGFSPGFFFHNCRWCLSEESSTYTFKSKMIPMSHKSRCYWTRFEKSGLVVVSHCRGNLVQNNLGKHTVSESVECLHKLS